MCYVIEEIQTRFRRHDVDGQRALREHIPDLIEVAPEEALRFACNSVVLGRELVIPDGCRRLDATLRDRGYIRHPIPVSEFIKAGGACKCLTFFIPRK